MHIRRGRITALVIDKIIELTKYRTVFMFIIKLCFTLYVLKNLSTFMISHLCMTHLQ